MSLREQFPSFAKDIAYYEELGYDRSVIAESAANWHLESMASAGKLSEQQLEAAKFVRENGGSYQFLNDMKAGRAYSSVYERMKAKQDPSLEVGEPEQSFTGNFGRALSGGIHQVQGLGMGLFAAAADAVGLDNTADWALKGYQDNMKVADETRGPQTSFTDWWESDGANLKGFTHFVAGALGENVPTMMTMIGTGGLGSVILKKVAQKTISKAMAKKIGEQAIARGAEALATLGTGAAMETGSIMGDVHQKTGEKRAGVAVGYGLVAGGLEAIVPLSQIRKIGGDKVADGLIDKVVRWMNEGNVAERVIKSGAGELSTEGAQTVIEKLAVQHVDENIEEFGSEGLKEIINAMAAGGVTGGPMGIWGGSSKDKGPTISEEQEQKDNAQGEQPEYFDAEGNPEDPGVVTEALTEPVNPGETEGKVERQPFQKDDGGRWESFDQFLKDASQDDLQFALDGGYGPLEDQTREQIERRLYGPDLEIEERVKRLREDFENANDPEVKREIAEEIESLEGARKSSTLTGRSSSLQGKASSLEGRSSDYNWDGKSTSLEGRSSSLEGKASSLEGRSSPFDVSKVTRVISSKTARDEGNAGDGDSRSISSPTAKDEGNKPDGKARRTGSYNPDEGNAGDGESRVISSETARDEGNAGSGEIRVISSGDLSEDLKGDPSETVFGRHGGETIEERLLNMDNNIDDPEVRPKGINEAPIKDRLEFVGGKKKTKLLSMKKVLSEKNPIKIDEMIQNGDLDGISKKNQEKLADHYSKISSSSLVGRNTSLEGRSSSLEGKSTSLVGKSTSLEGKNTSLVGKSTSLQGRKTSLEGRNSSLIGYSSTLDIDGAKDIGRFYDVIDEDGSDSLKLLTPKRKDSKTIKLAFYEWIRKTKHLKDGGFNVISSDRIDTRWNLKSDESVEMYYGSGDGNIWVNNYDSEKDKVSNEKQFKTLGPAIQYAKQLAKGESIEQKKQEQTPQNTPKGSGRTDGDLGTEQASRPEASQQSSGDVSEAFNEVIRKAFEAADANILGDWVRANVKDGDTFTIDDQTYLVEISKNGDITIQDIEPKGGVVVLGRKEQHWSRENKKLASMLTIPYTDNHGNRQVEFAEYKPNGERDVSEAQGLVNSQSNNQPTDTGKPEKKAGSQSNKYSDENLAKVLQKIKKASIKRKTQKLDESENLVDDVMHTIGLKKLDKLLEKEGMTVSGILARPRDGVFSLVKLQDRQGYAVLDKPTTQELIDGEQKGPEISDSLFQLKNKESDGFLEYEMKANPSIYVQYDPDEKVYTVGKQVSSSLMASDLGMREFKDQAQAIEWAMEISSMSNEEIKDMDSAMREEKDLEDEVENDKRLAEDKAAREERRAKGNFTEEERFSNELKERKKELKVTPLENRIYKEFIRYAKRNYRKVNQGRNFGGQTSWEKFIAEQTATDWFLDQIKKNREEGKNFATTVTDFFDKGIEASSDSGKQGWVIGYGLLLSKTKKTITDPWHNKIIIGGKDITDESFWMDLLGDMFGKSVIDEIIIEGSHLDEKVPASTQQEGSKQESPANTPISEGRQEEIPQEVESVVEKPGVDAEQKEVNETPKIEQERLDELDEGDALVLSASYFMGHPGVVTYRGKGDNKITYPPFWKLVSDFAKAVPEFAQTPVFVYQEGALTFTNGYKFKFSPETYGLPRMPEGTKIRVDLDSFKGVLNEKVGVNKVKLRPKSMLATQPMFDKKMTIANGTPVAQAGGHDWISDVISVYRGSWPSDAPTGVNMNTTNGPNVQLVLDQLAEGKAKLEPIEAKFGTEIMTDNGPDEGIMLERENGEGVFLPTKRFEFAHMQYPGGRWNLLISEKANDKSENRNHFRRHPLVFTDANGEVAYFVSPTTDHTYFDSTTPAGTPSGVKKNPHVITKIVEKSKKKKRTTKQAKALSGKKLESVLNGFFEYKGDQDISKFQLTKKETEEVVADKPNDLSEDEKIKKNLEIIEEKQAKKEPAPHKFFIGQEVNVTPTMGDSYQGKIVEQERASNGIPMYQVEYTQNGKTGTMRVEESMVSQQSAKTPGLEGKIKELQSQLKEYENNGSPNSVLNGFREDISNRQWMSEGQRGENLKKRSLLNVVADDVWTLRPVDLDRLKDQVDESDFSWDEYKNWLSSFEMKPEVKYELDQMNEKKKPEMPIEDKIGAKWNSLTLDERADLLDRTGYKKAEITKYKTRRFEEFTTQKQKIGNSISIKYDMDFGDWKNGLNGSYEPTSQIEQSDVAAETNTEDESKNPYNSMNHLIGDKSKDHWWGHFFHIKSGRDEYWVMPVERLKNGNIRYVQYEGRYKPKWDTWGSGSWKFAEITALDPSDVPAKYQEKMFNHAASKKPTDAELNPEKKPVSVPQIGGARKVDHSDISRVRPKSHAEGGDRVQLANGQVWEYKGISGYEADNKGRVKGWEKLGNNKQIPVEKSEAKERFLDKSDVDKAVKEKNYTRGKRFVNLRTWSANYFRNEAEDTPAAKKANERFYNKLKKYKQGEISDSLLSIEINSMANSSPQSGPPSVGVGDRGRINKTHSNSDLVMEEIGLAMTLRQKEVEFLGFNRNQIGVLDYLETLDDPKRISDNKESKIQDFGEKITGDKDSDPQRKNKGDLEDFGERIEGAAKHNYERYKNKLESSEDLNVEDLPLSKSFPAPNYEKLIEEGVDPWVVSFVRSSREEIPRKPTKSGRRSLWAKDVEQLRKMAFDLLYGNLQKDEVKSKAESTSSLAGLMAKTEAYVRFGQDVDLTNYQFSGGTYTYVDGKSYPKGKFLYGYKKSKRSFGDHFHGTFDESIDQLLDKFESKEIPKIKDSKESGGEKPQKKRGPKFSVYQRRFWKEGDSEAKYFIGYKSYGDLVAIEEGASAADLRKMINEDYDSLVEKLTKMKEIPNMRRDGNRERMGDDYRSGKDISQSEFQEIFGFRGGQFGNSMPQKERTENLNRTYDSLMDLSEIIGIPPKALSLNGELGIAFGARGRGGKNAASAHYEPGQIVINLTRKSGAGSLAHEWFHALDNYLSRQTGKRMGMQTENDSEIRPELREIFRKLNDAIKKTDIRERSKELDKFRKNPYWNTNVELGARTFEQYILKKTNDKGYHNDYLVNIAPEVVFGGNYPYLKDSEMETIEPIYDELFSTVKTEVTEKGLKLYSKRMAEPEFSPDTEAKIVSEVRDLMGQLKGLKKAKIKFAKGGKKGIRGMANTKTGEVTLYLDQLKAKDVKSLLIHEDFVHIALRGIIGDQAYNNLRNRALNAPEFAALRQEIRKVYGNISKSELGDEVLAHWYEFKWKQDANKGMIKHIVDRVKRWFKRHFGGQLSDYEEIAGVMAEAFRKYKNGKRGPGGPNGRRMSKKQSFGKVDTNSKEFKEWFGESKVVDSKGAPLVVYHGTETGGFSSFDEYEIGSKTGNATHGFYFTSSLDNASTYLGRKADRMISGATVDDVFENKSDLNTEVIKLGDDHYALMEGDSYVFEPDENATEDEIRDYISEEILSGFPGVYPAYLKLENPLVVDFKGRNWNGSTVDGEFDDQMESMVDIEERAKQDGHDGVIAKNVYDNGIYQSDKILATTYIVFKPTNIKSATTNTGDFSSSNPDIRYSKSENQRKADTQDGRPWYEYEDGSWGDHPAKEDADLSFDSIDELLTDGGAVIQGVHPSDLTREQWGQHRLNQADMDRLEDQFIRFLEDDTFKERKADIDTDGMEFDLFNIGEDKISDKKQPFDDMSDEDIKNKGMEEWDFHRSMGDIRYSKSLDGFDWLAGAMDADEAKSDFNFDFDKYDYSESQLKGAVASNKVDKVNAPVENGRKVSIRLDLPSAKKGVSAVTIHDKKIGTTLSYRKNARLQNVEMVSREKAALKIKDGGQKSPMAAVYGEFVDDASIPSDIESWTEVRYNPKKHSYFYTADGQDVPVTSGSEAFMVGNSVFVKDPNFDDQSNYLFSKSEDKIRQAARLAAEKPSKPFLAAIRDAALKFYPEEKWPNLLRENFTKSLKGEEDADMNKFLRHVTTMTFKADKYGGPFKEFVETENDRSNERTDMASFLLRMTKAYQDLTPEERAKVDELLIAGDKEGKDLHQPQSEDGAFGPKEMDPRFTALTPKQQEAFVGLREMFDAVKSKMVDDMEFELSKMQDMIPDNFDGDIDKLMREMSNVRAKMLNLEAIIEQNDFLSYKRIRREKDKLNSLRRKGRNLSKRSAQIYSEGAASQADFEENVKQIEEKIAENNRKVHEVLARIETLMQNSSIPAQQRKNKMNGFEKKLSGLQRKIDKYKAKNGAYNEIIDEIQEKQDAIDAMKATQGYFPRLRDKGQHLTYWSDEKNTWVRHVFRDDKSDDGDVALRQKMDELQEEGKVPFQELKAEHALLDKEYWSGNMNKDHYLEQKEEIRKKGYKLERVLDLPDELFSSAMQGSDQTMTMMNISMQQAGFEGKRLDAANDAIRTMFYSRGWRKHLLSRKGVHYDGYKKENLHEVINQFIHGFAGLHTKAEAAKRHYKTLQKLKPTEQPEIYSNMVAAVKDALRNADATDRISNKLNSLVYHMYLGFRASSAIINATQNFMLGVPMLGNHLRSSKSPELREKGKKGGFEMKAAKDFAKAMKDAWSYMHFKAKQEKDPSIEPPKGLTKDEIKFLDLEYNRILKTTLTQEMTENLAQEETKMGKIGSTLSHYSGLMFSKTEQMNRLSSLIVYKRYFKPEGNGADLILRKDAEKFVRDIHFSYDKWNSLDMFKSPTMRLLKPFFFSLASYNQNLMQNLTMMDGRALAGFTIALTLMAGIPLEELWEDELMDNLGTHSHKALGSGVIGRFARSGLPGVGIPGVIQGINMSGSLALSPPPMLKAIFEMTGIEDLNQGPFQTLVKNSFNLVSEGFTEEAWRKYTPWLAGRSAIQALNEYNDGLKTRSGRIMTMDGEAIKRNGVSAAMKFFGFNPSDVSEIKSRHWRDRQLSGKWQDDKADLVSEFVKAKTIRERTDIHKKIKEFNRKVMEMRKEFGKSFRVAPITKKSIASAKRDYRLHSYPKTS